MNTCIIVSCNLDGFRYIFIFKIDQKNIFLNFNIKKLLMDIVYKKKNKLLLWMLLICMKYEYCKYRYLLRMLMWLGMIYSSDIRVF